MKCTVERVQLEYALALLRGVIGERPLTPVLGGVLLEAGPGDLRCAADNLDQRMEVTIGASVVTPGSIILPAPTLTNIVDTCPGADQIEIDQRQAVVGAPLMAAIYAGRARFELDHFDVADHPRARATDPATAATLSAKLLRDALDHTVFAVSQEESRPILQGARWRRQDGRLQVVATNGHLLAIWEAATDTASDGPDVIVPARALELIGQLFDESGVPLQLALSADHLFLTITQDDVVLGTRLIEGPFPSIEQVLPKTEAPYVATLPVGEFQQALHRARCMESDDAPFVKLSFEPERVTVRNQTTWRGRFEEELPCTFAGEPLDIGFNIDYVLEILGRTGGGSVRLSMWGNGPKVTRWELVDQPRSASFHVLLMPIRLHD